MPEAEPYRAWATFSFTAQSGRVNECDLLVAVPAGLFLVEIKSHPGELRNTGSTWNFRGDDRVRTINNPLHFNDLKSKELRSQWAAALRGKTAGAAVRKSAAPVKGADPEAGLTGILSVDDMAGLLTPPPGRKGSHRADVVRLTLGLPPEDGGLSPLGAR
jgi:hypothetical protein